MPPTFEFKVDGENYTTSEHTLTPNQLLQIAGLDVPTHYLVEIKNKKQESLKDRMNEPIQMHQHMDFLSVYTGPTPVS
jgi:hypothetical protein